MPTVSIQLTYTYGCIDNEEQTACDLVRTLETLRVKYSSKSVLFHFYTIAL